VRALVQRVSRASVTSRPSRDGAAEETGRIGPGLVALVGVTHDDTDRDAGRLADKIAGLRVFDDADGVMNRSCLDVAGDVLVVSQFTLYGDTRKGRRPSYVAAARPEHAEPRVDAVVDRLRHLGLTVATGRFRTHMEVTLTNDGPVTLWIEI
jgi:D-tyrosyl-tRNA(Tyr) deacylase